MRANQIVRKARELGRKAYKSDKKSFKEDKNLSKILEQDLPSKTMLRTVKSWTNGFAYEGKKVISVHKDKIQEAQKAWERRLTEEMMKNQTSLFDKGLNDKPGFWTKLKNLTKY